MSLQRFPSGFCSIQLTVWEMAFKEFQYGCHGGHPGYQNRTILAILNIYVAPIPPIKFWLSWTYGLGGYVVWRISRGPPWRPSWIPERNYFSNSESLQSSNASHQVSAQSDLWFGRRCRLKNFKMDPWRLSWLLERNDFSNSESLCRCDASHQLLVQSSFRFGRRCRLKNFKMPTMAAILDIRTERF